MKEMDMTEQAYRNGYAAGLADGKEAAKPKWIPVTERLPEPVHDSDDASTWILLLHENGAVSILRCCCNIIELRAIMFRGNNHAIAWMPFPMLPEPPEVK